MSSRKLGLIKVGRCIYPEKTITEIDGFVTINVLCGKYKYSPLSPYSLTDDNGSIIENVWQFSKVYMRVPEVDITLNKWSKLKWKWPSETHVDSQYNVTPKYRAWRSAGMKFKSAIRYPVGFDYRHKCVASWWCPECTSHEVCNHEGEYMDYIQARKNIYMPLYCNSVIKHDLFRDLLGLLLNGVNLLIIDVDGPHQELLSYYQEKYGVGSDFINDNAVDVTNDNMQILLSDSKKPFGHGYCLAIALYKVALLEM